MDIHVWSGVSEYENERGEILDAVDHVFKSGRFILGESLSSFEKEFALYCKADYGVGVDNGTNAITLALRAAGVRPGDEVITVPNTAAPTVVAAIAFGARVRLVDIEPNNYLMDVTRLDEAITARTVCLLPVHLYGQCVDMDEVRRVAGKHKLLVVEDCAQAHGALYRDVPAGSMSAAGAFSFYPTKVLGAYGDAGMVITDDEAIAKRLRQLRCYGMEADRYYVVGPGYNARLDEVQAEILRRKLRKLESYIARRRALAKRYAAFLAGSGIALPTDASGNRHVYYLYVVRHRRRDEIIKALEGRGIFLNVSYRWPIHKMRGFAHLGYRDGDFPNAERAADEIFSLPMYPSLTDEQQERVCEELLSVVRDLA